MTPDPAFLTWFDTVWSEMLRAASVPGMPTASWDRKAAWLLWQATRPEPVALVEPETSAFD